MKLTLTLDRNCAIAVLYKLKVLSDDAEVEYAEARTKGCLEAKEQAARAAENRWMYIEFRDAYEEAERRAQNG
jgi:hypothetical protein